MFVLFDEFLNQSLDENNSVEDKYKLIGRLMYKEFLKLDENSRFHLIILDNYAAFDNLLQFKYRWLLREKIDHEKDSKEKHFQKPIRFNLDKLDQIHHYLVNIKKCLI